MNRFKSNEIRQELRHEDKWNSQQSSKPKFTGMWMFNVPKDKEDLAISFGLSKTKSGKWGLKVYNTSGRTASFKIKTATEEFGSPNFWAPKNESYRNYLDIL